MRYFDLSHFFLRLFLILAFFSIALSVNALEIPPRTSNFVNDYASLLSQDAKQRMEKELEEFSKQTSTQILVATFPSLENESLEDFTNRLFETWRPGLKEENNGILLAVFLKERKVRIEVGYGLEGALTDALSAQIIRNELAPHFRAGNYEKGIENAVAAIQNAVRGEYKAIEETPVQIPISVIVFAIILILFFISQMRRRGFTIGPKVKRGHYWDGGFFPGGWTRHSGGFGGISGSEDFSRSSGGFGGGFSGGGGLSGGGGASGSW